jgi:pyrroloquinoline quinone (PQQ) biosynthesis protein C
MFASTSAERLVEEFGKRAVAEHPLFVALRSRAVDHSALWLLLANLQVGISSHFVIWLARTIEKVEDRRIASLIAKQLNDELGNGQFEDIHSGLLRRFVQALERWRPAGADASVFQPGVRLHDAQEALFASDAYAMVGALMTGEIFANKMDHCLGDEIRRQNQIEPAALRWLVLHETLEEHHAGDSSELAKLVPASEPAASATTRGAIAQWDVLWRFLDDVHVQVQRLDAQRS